MAHESQVGMGRMNCPQVSFASDAEKRYAGDVWRFNVLNPLRDVSPRNNVRPRWRYNGVEAADGRGRCDGDGQRMQREGERGQAEKKITATDDALLVQTKPSCDGG